MVCFRSPKPDVQVLIKVDPLLQQFISNLKPTGTWIFNGTARSSAATATDCQPIGSKIRSSNTIALELQENTTRTMSSNNLGVKMHLIENWRGFVPGLLCLAIGTIFVKQIFRQAVNYAESPESHRPDLSNRPISLCILDPFNWNKPNYYLFQGLFLVAFGLIWLLVCSFA